MGRSFSNMEETMKRFILISLLAAAASIDSSTDSPSLLTNSSDISNITTNNNNTNITCAEAVSCKECFTNTTATCIFVIYEEDSQGCHPSDFQPSNDPIPPHVVKTLDQCSDGGHIPITTLPPPETTTAGTSTTTSNSSTSTTTTTATTTTTTLTTTTTTPTTSPPSDVKPVPAP